MSFRLRLGLASIACVAALCGCDDDCVVHVRNGDDLQRVRDDVRALRSKGETRRIVVVIDGGRYQLDQAVELDGRDSQVTWCAKPGADVHIAGGMIVKASPAKVDNPSLLARLPVKARSEVVQFDLAALGISDFGDYIYNPEDAIQHRVGDIWDNGDVIMGSFPAPKGSTSVGRMELFVNDQPLVLARSPQGSPYHLVLSGYSKIGKFNCKEEIPSAWTNEPNPYLVGCWHHDWAEQHQRIVKLDLDKRYIELSQPYHQYGYNSTGYFYAFNMLCELDTPGEWYADRDTGKLVVWPPKDVDRDLMRLEVSVAGRLFELDGATNVVFSGLLFETCRNTAVKMKDCERCALENCVVRNVGQHALIVEDGHECGARGCEFFGMGGGGAFLADGNRMTLERSDHFVENCDIHDFGRWNRMYRPGVYLSGVGMRAVGNRIHDNPHSAILYFGCEHLLASNEIFRACNDSNDCGAFYSGKSWLHRGNRIIGNYFHDIIGRNGNYARTVYIDDCSAQYEVSGNRFERCTWGVFLGGGRENVITNNVFVDCPNALFVDARGRSWEKWYVDQRCSEIATKGTLYGVPIRSGVYAERYPALKDLPGSDRYSPVLNVIAHNEFIRGKAEWINRFGVPGIRNSELWWRGGEVSNEELSRLGVFEDNRVDNSSLK